MAAQPPGAALFDISAGHTDRAESCQTNGRYTGPAVLDSYDMVPLSKGNPEPDPADLRIEPGVWFGRKLSERAGRALAHRESGRNNRIVEFARIAQAQRPKGRQNLRVGLFVQTRSHQADANLAVLEPQ